MGFIREFNHRILKNMKVQPYLRGILFGFITALITTSVAISIYYGVSSSEDEGYELLPPFEWDFSSMKALSLQMNERSEHIIALTTETSIVGPNGGSTSIPYFNYTVFSIHSWYIVENDKQILQMMDYLDNTTEYETYYIINDSVLNPLYPALTTELEAVQNHTDVSENYWIEINETRKPGVFSFEIKQIYRDGSMFWIETYDNTIFIRLVRFTEYIGTPTSWGIRLENPEEFEDGRSKYDYFYKGEILELFPIYTEAINEFLEQFY